MRGAPRLGSFAKRNGGMIAVLLVGAIVMPVAIEKGGLFPWIAIGGVGSAMLAVYLWAFRSE